MSFGNNIGFQIKYDEKLLDAYNYGSIVVESKGFMNYKNAILIGRTKLRSLAVVNGVKFSLEDLYEANRGKFTEVYKDMVDSNSSLINIKTKKKKIVPLKNKDEVIAYFPVFPGTNCDYDTEKKFRNAGATIRTSVFRNLTSEDIFSSIDEMAKNIDEADIFVLSGGFSAGDEPDGSGKFIANVLNQDKIKDAINRLIERKGLILGICNGFHHR